MVKWTDIWRTGPLFLMAVAVSTSVSVAGIAFGLILLAAIAIVLKERGAVMWPPRPVLLALGALIGTYFLATLLSKPYPHNWYKFGEELWFKLLLVAVPVVAGNRPRLIERVLKIALIIGVVAALYAVIQHFLGVDLIRGRSIYRPQFGHNAVSGFFSHHLSFAGQALIFLIMTAAWFLDWPTRRRSLWLVPALALLGSSLVWSFARSAMIGAMAGLLVLVLLQNGRARWWSLAGVLGGLLVIMTISPVRSHFLQVFQLDQHLTRLHLWESSWNGVVANPLLGFGPGNFDYLLAGYKVPGHYEALGHSHHDLLMHGVNAGVPGILAALGLLAATCWVFWRAGHTSSSVRWAFHGALAVQAGITVGGFFQVFQTDDEVEILLYFILGCALALAGCSGPGTDQKEAGI